MLSVASFIAHREEKKAFFSQETFGPRCEESLMNDSGKSVRARRREKDVRLNGFGANVCTSRLCYDIDFA